MEVHLEQITNLESWQWIFIFACIGISVIVGFIALIIFVGRRILNPKKKQLDILRERLAKGEVTQEEYDKLKKEFE